MTSRRMVGRVVALVKPRGPDVPAKSRLLLFARAGGRCEFDGCNRYLLEHHLTKTEGVFAQMAHIWAFSERGPRGSRRLTQGKHDISNLMLLCAECHKLVDDHPERYTTDVLLTRIIHHELRFRALRENVWVISG